MSNSPKEKKKSASNKKTQRILLGVILGVLLLIICAALTFVFVPDAGGMLSCSSGKYDPEIQTETTNISPYYEGGVLPTSGSIHEVEIAENGGADGAQLEGQWMMDDITKYLFDGKGRGIMLTAVDNYTFVYSAADGKLDIDYDVDEGTDREYQYMISGDKLTLTLGDTEYNLTKEVQ